jgi:purine-nucleoside phosphorylase
MSTVPEIIALRHMGVPAAAISCITNLAAGLTTAELCHAEVEETARRSRARFVELLSAWVRLAGASRGGASAASGADAAHRGAAS